MSNSLIKTIRKHKKLLTFAYPAAFKGGIFSWDEKRLLIISKWKIEEINVSENNNVQNFIDQYIEHFEKSNSLKEEFYV